MGFDSTIRPGEIGEYVTTSVKSELDAGMQVTRATLIGANSHDVQRVTLTPRDALGRVLSETVREFDDPTSPLVRETRYVRNLLGWPRQVVTQTLDDATNTDEANFVFNARGQQISITDPDKQVTHQEYNTFGDLVARYLPDDLSTAHDAYTYDGYGRTTVHHQKSGDEIGFEYDPNRDLVRERWLNYSGAGSNVLSAYTWDERGRLSSSLDYNLARTSYGASSLAVFRTFAYDALDRTLEAPWPPEGGTVRRRRRTVQDLVDLDGDCGRVATRRDVSVRQAS